MRITLQEQSRPTAPQRMVRGRTGFEKNLLAVVATIAIGRDG